MTPWRPPSTTAINPARRSVTQNVASTAEAGLLASVILRDQNSGRLWDRGCSIVTSDDAPPPRSLSSWTTRTSCACTHAAPSYSPPDRADECRSNGSPTDQPDTGGRNLLRRTPTWPVPTSRTSLPVPRSCLATADRSSSMSRCPTAKRARAPWPRTWRAKRASKLQLSPVLPGCRPAADDGEAISRPLRPPRCPQSRREGRLARARKSRRTHAPGNGCLPGLQWEVAVVGGGRFARG